MPGEGSLVFHSNWYVVFICRLAHHTQLLAMGGCTCHTKFSAAHPFVGPLNLIGAEAAQRMHYVRPIKTLLPWYATSIRSASFITSTAG